MGHALSRQLMFDASPVKGVEIFSFRERVIVRGQIEASKSRKMALVTVAVGHFVVEDKCMALRHDIFLEGGPTASDMRQWSSVVRVTLPDSGTERLLNDAPDVYDEYLVGTLENVDWDAKKAVTCFLYLMGARGKPPMGHRIASCFA